MALACACAKRRTRCRKPLIPVGQEPILLHIMKYYAHYGHTDSSCASATRATSSRRSSWTDETTLSTSLVMARDGWAPESCAAKPRLEDHLRRHRPGRQHRRPLARRAEHLGDDEMFLANYSDTLTDAPLPAMIAGVREQGAVASFLAVPADLHVSRRVVRERPPRAQHRVGVGGRHLDQRRLLRPPPRDLRLHASRATSWSRRRSGG